MAAPEDAKAMLGLAGKRAADFRYLTADSTEADSVIEGRTDAQRSVSCSGVHRRLVMVLANAVPSLPDSGFVSGDPAPVVLKCGMDTEKWRRLYRSICV